MPSPPRSQSRAMEVDAHRLEYASPVAPTATPEQFGPWIIRHRWWMLGTILVVYALSFTGEWRIGRDSALYRGLGHTLATGRGFTFSEFGRRQIYPGLPVMLAGLEPLFRP